MWPDILFLFYTAFSLVVWICAVSVLVCCVVDCSWAWRSAGAAVMTGTERVRRLTRGARLVSVVR